MGTQHHPRQGSFAYSNLREGCHARDGSYTRDGDPGRNAAVAGVSPYDEGGLVRPRQAVPATWIGRTVRWTKAPEENDSSAAEEGPQSLFQQLERHEQFGRFGPRREAQEKRRSKRSSPSRRKRAGGRRKERSRRLRRAVKKGGSVDWDLSSAKHAFGEGIGALQAVVNELCELMFSHPLPDLLRD